MHRLLGRDDLPAALAVISRLARPSPRRLWAPCPIPSVLQHRCCSRKPRMEPAHIDHDTCAGAGFAATACSRRHRFSRSVRQHTPKASALSTQHSNADSPPRAVCGRTRRARCRPRLITAGLGRRAQVPDVQRLRGGRRHAGPLPLRRVREQGAAGRAGARLVQRRPWSVEHVWVLCRARPLRHERKLSRSPRPADALRQPLCMDEVRLGPHVRLATSGRL